MSKTITYNGIKFSVRGKYYRGIVKGKPTQLHRYKYRREVGRIPRGYLIHHVDGDKLNNKINNLRRVTFRQHINLHKYPNLVPTCRIFVTLTKDQKGRMISEARSRGISQGEMIRRMVDHYLDGDSIKINIKNNGTR